MPVPGERRQAGRAVARLPSVETASIDPPDAMDRPAPRHRRPTAAGAGAVAVGALAASTIVVAAVSVVGDTWFPTGDFSGLWFRISQVGTRSTPLVGAESIKGFAHPGPLAFWLAAPVHWLAGGDPRSMLWTAAAVNVAAVAAIVATGWRRGGWPLLLGLALLLAVLSRTLSPETVVSFWNPFLPLLPFLATVVLVWDIGLGGRRSIVPAALAASLAAQTHLAFVVLLGVVLAWLVLWSILWPRLLPGAAGAGLPGRSGSEWLRVLRPGLVVLAVLAVPMVLDALFDLHNPLQIGAALYDPAATVGPADALSVVGRYLRPDGPWIGGAEPTHEFSIEGSGPVPLVAALALLAACGWIGRRRRQADVVALVTLSALLVIGAVPATSQIVVPLYPYMTQPLKLIGGLAWLTVAYTAWRASEAALRRARWPVPALGAVVVAGLVAVSVATWPDAGRIGFPEPVASAAVQDLRAQLVERLEPGSVVRVEYRGDPLNLVGPGVIGWLIEDGFDVLTSDGAHGLKWGHEHRYTDGDAYDTLLVVAVHYEQDLHNAFSQCRDAGAELVAEHDSLTADERAFVEDVRLRMVGGPGLVSAAEEDRVAAVVEGGLRVGVFEARGVCATHYLPQA